MFSWFMRKPAEDWRLVKTISVPIQLTANSKRDGTLYYHLFESSLGNRRVTFATTLAEVQCLDVTAKTLSAYHETIFRWEHGRHDPAIPRYSDIPEEETVNALRGKVQ